MPRSLQHGHSENLNRTREATRARQDEALRLHRLGVPYIEIARQLGFMPGGRPNAQSAHAAAETARRREGALALSNPSQDAEPTSPDTESFVDNFMTTYSPVVGTAHVPVPRAIPNIPSTRTYGVECEFFGITHQRAVEVLRAEGIDVSWRDYTHDHVHAWKIVRDGSVAREGLELVSPILSGPEGLAAIKLALGALQRAGATVNQTCGVHVHIAADGLTGAEVMKVVKTYVANQAHINNLVAQSRHNQTYCRPLSLHDTDRGGYADLATISRCRNNFKRDQGRQLDDAIARAGRGTTRYHVVNLNSYAKYGTLEFRQHQGSLSGNKVTTWIVFLLGLMEKALEAGEPRDFGSVPNLLESLPIEDAVRSSLLRRSETLVNSRRA